MNVLKILIASAFLVTTFGVSADSDMARTFVVPMKNGCYDKGDACRAQAKDKIGHGGDNMNSQIARSKRTLKPVK